MKTDYAPALRPRGRSELRCGHTDCRYYAPHTDSCDYLLIEYRPRGCAAAPDCPRYAPVGLSPAAEEALAARMQAYEDMGMSTRQIARRLRVCEPALRLLRARRARAGGNVDKSAD